MVEYVHVLVYHVLDNLVAADVTMQSYHDGVCDVGPVYGVLDAYVAATALVAQTCAVDG